MEKTSADSAGGMDKLPDEILVLILSNLTLKEAARTSVLSHRWETLWIYSTGSLNLNFDPMDDMGNIVPKKHWKEFEKRRYVRWVDRILALHQGQAVDELRVAFDLGQKYAEDIERWIKFAIKKRVSRFELDFSTPFGYEGIVERYSFSYKLFHQPGDFSTSFGPLIALRLIAVDLSDEVLSYFILNCHSLEHLSIKGASSLTCLKATTALKLKHLEIEYCDGLESIEIANTNIESLRFIGSRETKIPIRELPLLSELSLGGTISTLVIEGKFRLLPIFQLRTLHLHLDFVVYYDDIMFPKKFRTCINLKHLKVRLMTSHDESIFCLTSLLHASPTLSRLTVEIDDRAPRKRVYKLPIGCWKKSERHVHRCLEVVEFSGWHGHKNDLEFVSYLIENSPLLEKVVIDPRIPVFEGEYIPKFWRKREMTKGREETCRNRAKRLKEKVPTGIELVIL